LLQLAAETGTLGVISFIVLFGVIIWSLYSYYQAAEENHLKLFFLGTLGVIVAYLSHGLTEYNLYDMYVSRLVWFILAISLVLKTKFGLIMESD
jgi:O-antigen ligase